MYSCKTGNTALRIPAHPRQGLSRYERIFLFKTILFRDKQFVLYRGVVVGRPSAIHDEIEFFQKGLILLEHYLLTRSQNLRLRYQLFILTTVTKKKKKSDVCRFYLYPKTKIKTPNGKLTNCQYFGHYSRLVEKKKLFWSLQVRFLQGLWTNQRSNGNEKTFAVCLCLCLCSCLCSCILVGTLALLYTYSIEEVSNASEPPLRCVCRALNVCLLELWCCSHDDARETVMQRSSPTLWSCSMCAALMRLSCTR